MLVQHSHVRLRHPLLVQVKLSMPAVTIMERFDARDLTYTICLAATDELAAAASVATRNHVVNAFDLMREGSRRHVQSTSTSAMSTERLPPPAYNLTNSKIQLELDVHEVLDSLGLEAPPSQHEYLRKVLKVVVNFLWYIDPHHDTLRKRRGQLPKAFQHVSENSYNNFREKKQKAPPLQAEILETHVNELFSILATPSLKLPCNTRTLDALTELSSMAAMQVAQMKKHAQVMRTRREQLVVNDGNIAITVVEKKNGPFHREIEKCLIRELRALVYPTI